MLPRIGPPHLLQGPPIPHAAPPSLRQVLARNAITFLRNPRRARNARSLRRGGLSGNQSRLQFRIAPLGTFLHCFLFRNKGQVEATRAASRLLISQELVRVPRHALWPLYRFPVAAAEASAALSSVKARFRASAPN